MNRPIIGIIGGIGSGKSFVASLFGELGAYVIKSDDLAHAVYRQPAVKQTLRQWWGDEVLQADGSVNRKAIAARVFGDRAELKRLEELVHPLVNAERERLMEQAHADPAV
ncbi:MAG TPA: dephospho-CoA kinase, partial [Tepidisphaeraceae bacterium]